MRVTEIFSEPPSDLLIAALKRTETSYELLLDTVYFKLVRDSQAYNEIVPLVEQKDRLLLATYSESERKASAWLEICPRSQSVDILNTDDACDYSCTYLGSDGLEHAQHCTQSSPYEIVDEVKWGRRKCFSAPDNGGSEIFTCGVVKDLVESMGIKGCSFQPVYNRKTGNPCSNTFQLAAQTEIPISCISFGHGEREHICPLCGKKQYVLKNTYQFHLFQQKLPTSVDIICTPAVFHDGQAESVPLISQKFYQALKGAGLHHGLFFTPAVMI